MSDNSPNNYKAIEFYNNLISFIKPYQNKGHSELWIKKNHVPSIYSGLLHPDAPHDFHPVLVTPSGRPLAILDLSDNKWKASGITPAVCDTDSTRNNDKLFRSPEGKPVCAMEMGAFIADIEKSIICIGLRVPEVLEKPTKENGGRL